MLRMRKIRKRLKEIQNLRHKEFWDRMFKQFLEVQDPIRTWCISPSLWFLRDKDDKHYNPKTGLYEIPVRVERPDDWRNSERTNI